MVLRAGEDMSFACGGQRGADGKLALEIGSVRVKDRKDRMNYLRSHVGAGVTVFEAKLEDLDPALTPLFDDLATLVAAPRGRARLMRELLGPLGLAVWMSDAGRFELRAELFLPRQRALALSA